MPTMEFVAFIHPKEKFSTSHFLFSDRKRCVFVNGVHASSAAPLSHQLIPMPEWEDLPAYLPQNAPVRSGIVREQFKRVSFGLGVKQTQNEKNWDVKSIRKQIPYCTVVWRPLVNLPLIVDSYFLNDLFKRTASIVFASKSDVFTWNY